MRRRRRNAACTSPTTSRVGQAPDRTQTTKKERQAGCSWERAVEGNVTRSERTGARRRGVAEPDRPTARPATCARTTDRRPCVLRGRAARSVAAVGDDDGGDLRTGSARAPLRRRSVVRFGSFVRSKVRSFPRLAVGRGRGVFQVLRQLRVGLVPAGAPLLRRRVRPARGARVRLPFAPMRRPDVPTTLVPRSGRARGDQRGGAVAP